MGFYVKSHHSLTIDFLTRSIISVDVIVNVNKKNQTNRERTVNASRTQFQKTNVQGRVERKDRASVHKKRKEASGVRLSLTKDNVKEREEYERRVWVIDC